MGPYVDEGVPAPKTPNDAAFPLATMLLVLEGENARLREELDNTKSRLASAQELISRLIEAECKEADAARERIKSLSVVLDAYKDKASKTLALEASTHEQNRQYEKHVGELQGFITVLTGGAYVVASTDSVAGGSGGNSGSGITMASSVAPGQELNCYY